MSMNVRFAGAVAVLSNFGRLLNDPRHFDAAQGVNDLLDEGYRNFVLELSGIRQVGPTAIGLLVTLTRKIRQGGGEVVLANLNPATEKSLEDMRMDAFWDVFMKVENAMESFEERE